MDPRFPAYLLVSAVLIGTRDRIQRFGPRTWDVLGPGRRALGVDRRASRAGAPVNHVLPAIPM